MAVSILLLYEIIERAEGRQHVNVSPLGHDACYLRKSWYTAMLPKRLGKTGNKFVCDTIRGNLAFPSILVCAEPPGPELSLETISFNHPCTTF